MHDAHQDLLAKEATNHDQHFKNNGALDGDRNTGFFHQAIIKRNRNNRISHLQNPNGSVSTTPTQIAQTLTDYFSTIFSTSQALSPRDIPIQNSPSTPANHSFTPQTVPVDHATQHQHGEFNPTHQDQEPQLASLFRYTYSTPSLNEIHDIIKNMRSDAAPGPDGFNVVLLQILLDMR